MPRKRKLDGKKLLAAIQAGTNSKEIMDKFGIKTAAQLKVAYADALMQSGTVPEIVSSRGSGKPEKASREIQVGKRGSLIISKEMVDELGFAMGDGFTVRKTKSGINLKKSD